MYDLERRLLMHKKLETGDVLKVKERVEALAAQQDPTDLLILITLDELARFSRKLGYIYIYKCNRGIV